jgi:hypothetical protein
VDKEGKVKGRAINALGAVIHYNRVTLRKSILKRMRKKARKIAVKDHPTWHDGASMFSRLSWIRHTNTYMYYAKYIKPYINTRELKAKVRSYSRATLPVAKERRRIINEGLEKSTRLTG